MNILLIGSGGREHALAWKIAQSPRLGRLFNLPGNPGTASLGTNLPASPEDHPAVLRAVRDHAIDLVVIGPEVPLASGLSDALRQVEIPVFGPSQAAAQIESSKAFSKAFMQRHGIPTAAYRRFTRLETALAELDRVSPQHIVIKASGLAAGKGVFLPETRAQARLIAHSLLVEGSLGSAGQEIVIEERLQGPEVSVLAFSDGKSVALMPPAQDHKRLLDGDQGPNTGGMGAFAPSPLATPALLDEIQRTALQPAVDGLRQEGLPFVGVLYAGMILSPAGPHVLEYNCRFGDPETQAILPLLQSDLLEIFIACVEGRLAGIAPGIRWDSGAAAVVVLASPGYPAEYPKGLPITGLDQLPDGVLPFHAGTALSGQRLTTAGGRVLGITARADSLPAALQQAYAGVSKIKFDGMQYRTDIGKTFATDANQPTPARYAASGVSIAAGTRSVELIRQSVRATFTAAVLSDVGSFGGLFSLDSLKDMQNPVLVASTDGVGTKVALAARAGLLAGIGQDIVNHCINDILVQGARPLFFLDYFAASKLEPERVAEIVAGMSAACREAGCALLGGETAEMPGVYSEGHFDVAGTIVGVVEHSQILPRPGIRPGDVLIGLASSGPHTNGFSLIRKVFDRLPLDTLYPELGCSLAAALLAPHRSYLRSISPFLAPGSQPAVQSQKLKALVHITGGGFLDNIPRVLPDGLGVRIQRQAWEVPPIFRLIQRLGAVDEAEMYHVFNMGIGMIIVADPTAAPGILSAVSEPAWRIGAVIEKAGVHMV